MVKTRTQGFTLDPENASRLRDLIDDRGISLTQVVEYALNEYGEIHAPRKRGIEMSVRLDADDAKQLDRLARKAKTSKSRTLALLLQRALDDLLALRPEISPPATTATLPGPRAYATWVKLLTECAHAVHGPGKFGERKVFISAAIDEVIQRTQPDEPDAVREQMRNMLLKLNELDLVLLQRADLIPVMPLEYVEASELPIPGTKVTFHFIELR